MWCRILGVMCSVCIGVIWSEKCDVVFRGMGYGMWWDVVIAINREVCILHLSIESVVSFGFVNYLLTHKREKEKCYLILLISSLQ